MNIDGDIIEKIIFLILGGLITAIWKEVFEKKSKLISFVSHVASFNVANRSSPNSPPLVFGTHITFIRNAGRKVATNVSVAHKILPDYKIYPDTPHEIRDLSEGGKEIFFSRLVAKELITISYLYQSPLQAHDIIGAVKSDDGFTKEINVNLQEQQPRWKILFASGLLITGVITLLYFVILGLKFLYIYFY